MIMKKILWICSVLLAMVSCQEDYELNTDFAVPTELSSPASIQLNVSSPTPVVLSWSGGGAADGGIVLYEVLFDKADGDFSKPLATVKSDLGAATSLSITHAAINTIASCKTSCLMVTRMGLIGIRMGLVLKDKP